MNKIITEKQMIKCINELKEVMISSQGEGDMPLQEFMKWVEMIIEDCYNWEVTEDA